MPPSEVEQLAFDLLADLAPMDERPESGAAVRPVRQYLSSISATTGVRCGTCTGDARESRANSKVSSDSARQKLGQVPPDTGCQHGQFQRAVCFNARLLAMLFGGASGSRQEAAEFNVASTTSESAVEIASGSGSPSSATRPSSEPEVKTKAAVATAPGKPPVIERPLIILSAPRAGSTLLFETLAQAAGVYTIGGESHQLIESIAALRPGRGVVSSNRLTRKDATTEIIAELRKRFAGKAARSRRAATAGGRRAYGCWRKPRRTRCAYLSCWRYSPTRSSYSCTGSRARISAA